MDSVVKIMYVSLSVKHVHYDKTKDTTTDISIPYEK